MGLREQKQDRTEKTIVRVAFRLFREQGYDGTTVEQIAAGSEIAPRTFYRYFETKDAVLAAPGSENVATALDRVPPGASVEELTRTLCEAIEDSFGHEYTEEVRRVLRDHPELRTRPAVWRAQWADQLADGLAAKEGRDAPDLRDRLRASTMMQLAAVALEEHLYRGGEREFAAVVDETLGLAADLFPPRGGRRAGG